MTRPRKWILMPAILIITLTALTGREARAAEGIFDRERFRVSERLFPDFQDADAKKMTPFREVFSMEGNRPIEAADPRAAGGRQRGLYGVHFGYFHLKMRI